MLSFLLLVQYISKRSNRLFATDVRELSLHNLYFVPDFRIMYLEIHENKV